jgi:formylmethanofuran dehydrogenase subunit E-like metal-binding protein
MIMKRFISVFLIVLLISCFAQCLQAANFKGLITEGIADLKSEKGSPTLLALTNATYVKVDGKTTEGYVDMIQETTGCSVGKGNLLFFHRPISHPLKIVLFKKDTADAIVMTYDGEKIGKLSLNINGEGATKPDGWKKIQEKLGPDTFSIVTIANAWANGAPYDFLRCSEFHNHLCPGIGTGYQIVKFIMDRYPLKEGENYTWIACPPWCKDDAIQMLLDLTSGKQNMFVKQLTEDQKKMISGEKLSDNIAGILVIWNKKAKKGTAVALRYNWGKAWQVSGVTVEEFKPKGGPKNPIFWSSRIKCNLGLMPYLNKPESFVTVVKELEINPQMYTQMTISGVNPYKVIGLSK